MERRRLTGVERAALSVAHQALEQIKQSDDQANQTALQIPVVFASRWGEIGTTVKLMQQMHGRGDESGRILQFGA